MQLLEPTLRSIKPTLRLLEGALEPLEPPLRRANLALKLHGGTLLDDVDDRKLIEGFLANDRKLTAVFVRLLLDSIRSELLRRWPNRRHEADDVEGRCLVLLMRWKGEGKSLTEHSVQGLAALLVNRSAVTEKRAQTVVKRVKEAAASEVEPAATSAEDETVANDLAAKLWELSAGLKASFQSVLRAHDAAQQGGPPIAEALGMEPASARKLLERAREALLARAKANRVELTPWLDEGER